MDPACRRRDLLRQFIRVGALELADAAILEDDARQIVITGEFLEYVLGRGGLPFRRLADDRQSLVLEQDLLQLFRRTEVERPAGDVVGLGLELRHRFCEIFALLFEHVAVEQNAGFLHGEQHRNQGLLYGRVHGFERFNFLQLAPQVFMQAQGDVRILGRIGCRLLQAYLVEGQLFGAFSGDVFVMDRIDVEVEASNRIHVVPGGDAVQHIGFQHGIERHAAKFDAVAGENVRIVLQVMPDFVLFRVFQERFHGIQDVVSAELFRCARVIVCHRNVGCLAGFHCHRDADQLSLHVIHTGRFGIDGDKIGFPDLLEPRVESALRQDSLVIATFPLRRQVLRGFLAVFQLTQELAQLEARIEILQFARIDGSALQVCRFVGQIDVLPNGGKCLRQPELLDVVPQALPDFALDLFGIGDDLIGAVVLIEPFRRCLGTHFRHARNIVRAVADKRQPVDDLFGIDVELLLDTIAVEDGAGHGIHQRDPVTDELRHVLVDCGYQYFHAGIGGLASERPDDIVRLDTFDTQ